MQQGEDNMARPTRICMEPAYDSFFPDGFFTGEEVIMTLDEYETIHLVGLAILSSPCCILFPSYVDNCIITFKYLYFKLLYI